MKGYLFLTTDAEEQNIIVLGISDERNYQKTRKYCFERNNYEFAKEFEFGELSEDKLQENLILWMLEVGVPASKINEVGIELYARIHEEISRDLE